MRTCPNPACPDRVDLGVVGHYVDSADVCARCGVQLVPEVESVEPDERAGPIESKDEVTAEIDPEPETVSVLRTTDASRIVFVKLLFDAEGLGYSVRNDPAPDILVAFGHGTAPTEFLVREEDAERATALLSEDYQLDEDAGRVVVDAARPATVDAPRPSDVRPGYRLGWLFVGLEGWNAIQLGRNLPNGGPLLDVAVFGALSSVILAVAAAWRSAWAWHVLLVTLLARMGSHVYVTARYVQLFGAPPAWALPLFVLLWSTDVLWFVYVYRRRSMFGAERRWHWAERLAPWAIARVERDGHG